MTVSEIASGFLIASKFEVTHDHTLSSTIIAGLSENAGTLLETFGDRSNEIEPRTAPGPSNFDNAESEVIDFYTYSTPVKKSKTDSDRRFGVSRQRQQHVVTLFASHCTHPAASTCVNGYARRFDLDSSTLLGSGGTTTGKYCVNPFHLVEFGEFY